MTDIERYVEKPSTLELANDAWRLAQRMAGTEFVPAALRNKPEAVLGAILVGHEAGVLPMQALAKIHIIEGRPAFSAELMRGLVLQAGHEVWIEESSSTRCVIAGKRKGSERETKVSWTLDDAQRAGLKGKQNWQRYPAAMLLARATAALCRMIFPDVLAGLSYTAEELTDGDVVDPLAQLEEPKAAAAAPARTARASRRATRGSDAPAETEPAPAVKVQRAEPALPGEDDDDVVEGKIVDEQPTQAAAQAPPADDGYEGPDQHVERSGTSYTGPQIIAMKLGERGIKDRDDRLAVVSAILELDEPLTTTKDLSHDDVTVVVTFLDGYPAGDVLPGMEAREEPAGAAPTTAPTAEEAPAPRQRAVPPSPAAAEDDPETWDSIRWRAFLTERKVKVAEVVKEAQRHAKDGEQVVGALDQIAGSGLGDTLRGFVEDLSVGRTA